MQSEEYWRKRSLEDKKRNINLTERFINRELKRSYSGALKEVQEALNKLYQGFADKEHITLQEAGKRMRSVNPKDLDALLQKAKAEREFLKKNRNKLPEAVIKAIEQRLDDYEEQLGDMSKKGYMSHLELSEAHIHSALLKLSDQKQLDIYDFMEEQYRDGYFRGVFEVQQGLGFGKDFAAPDTAAVRKAVMRTWSKKHFSTAIWGQQEKLSQELKTALTVGLIRGDGVEEMTKRITKRMDVSASNARRLVRTESAHIHEQAGLDSYQECGITSYYFLATLDRKTSPQCRELDGKTFLIAEAETGKNYPPIHPNCRSTTIPRPGTEATRRIARGADGKSYTVPGNMTYQQWYNGLSEDEKGRMSLSNRKESHESADRKQYERYKTVLEGRIGSFQEFQKQKYHDSQGYAKTQRSYKETKYVKEFQEKLQNGQVNLKVQRMKQEEHTQGTKALRNRLKQALMSQGTDKPITPQSYLYRGMDAQKLIQEHAGMGVLQYTLGSATVKEYISLDESVGRYYNLGKKRYEETKRFCIIYNNKGTHVFPVKDKEAKDVLDI